MSGGEVAALIAAVAFVVLVCLLAVPILKLGRTLDEATITLRKVDEAVGPLLLNANTAIQQVNVQLEHTQQIAQNAQAISTNVASVTALVSGVVSGPVVKLASLSYGLRRALTKRRKSEASKAVKSDRWFARRGRRRS